MPETENDLIEATREARERTRLIDANIAEVERLHATIRSDPGNLRRNHVLLAEAQGLLDANARMAAMNDLVIRRNAAELAERRRQWRAGLRSGGGEVPGDC